MELRTFLTYHSCKQDENIDFNKLVCKLRAT